MAGTGTLIRLALRRDRVVLPIWFCAGLLPMGVAASFAKLYPSPDSLRAFADQCMSNPAIVAILGPVFAPTVGGLTAWRTGAMGMIVAAIPSLLIVIRHTRAEEEAGQREIIGSTAVGRHAALSAALIVTLFANLVLAAVVATGLMSLGLPAAGSIALGLSWAAAGLMFAAVAALAAQLSASTATARNIALGVFGLFFLIHTAANSPGEHSGVWLRSLSFSPSSISPLEWTRLIRPFAGERWWLFALVAGFVAVLDTAAYALSARRDLGAGLLPPRHGPAFAPPRLRSPLALAWRLQRGMLLGWIVAFALIGLLLGAVSKTLPTLTNTPQFSNWLAHMGAHDSAHAFLRIVLYVLGQTIAAYAILATMRMRSEEMTLRAEPVLATSVSRLRWAASHLLFASAGPAAALFAVGLAIGLTYGINAGDVSRELPRLLAATMVTLPAVWVMAGIAMALFGLLPRFAASLSWAALAAFLVLELGWELRQVSQPVFDLSPFAHVHWSAQVTIAAWIWLTVVAVLLTTAGLFGLQRRDLG